MNPQPTQDRAVVLVVVTGLVLIALAVVGAGVYLASVGRELPAQIGTMGAVALGAVAGVLATTSTRPPPPPIQAWSDPPPDPARATGAHDAWAQPPAVDPEQTAA